MEMEDTAVADMTAHFTATAGSSIDVEDEEEARLHQARTSSIC